MEHLLVDRDRPGGTLGHALNRALDVLGAPPGERAGAEGDAGEGDGREDEGLVLGQALDVLGVGGCLELAVSLALAARRVHHQEEDEEDGDQAEDGGHAEAPAPVAARQVGGLGADDVAEAAADGDGKVEEGEHLGAGVLDEHVADDGGRDGGVARLPDADHGAAEEERGVVLHEGSDDGKDGPKEDAERHDEFARVAVAGVAKDGREDHVAGHEGGLQGSPLGVANLEVSLDLGQDTWKREKFDFSITRLFVYQ